MKLRSILVILVVAVLVPMLAFTAIVIGLQAFFGGFLLSIVAGNRARLAKAPVASAPTRIEFSSDYAIFFGLGIPFGGVFTGSSGIKTPEEAAVCGGQA